MFADTKIPISTVHLFPPLHSMLMNAVSSLTQDEWSLPTLATEWTVKDVASHILDGYLRGLSSSRDHYFANPSSPIESYRDLVSFLNKMNNEWITAAQRFSTDVLLELLDVAGKRYAQHLETLPPFGKAIFPVSWAGQEVSDNWFHIAREYTEQFHHQLQIRHAVRREEDLLTKSLYHPFISTLLVAFPHHFKDVKADTGTTVTWLIDTESGGEWSIEKRETGWQFAPFPTNASTTITIAPEDAWKLFTKGLSADEALPRVRMKGNEMLGLHALQMVCVMA